MGRPDDSRHPNAFTPPPACKRLILCADDFASSASASEGIATLARAGRVSATSAMVLSPRWANDASLLRELRGRIDVGLHLDWTSDFARGAGHGVSLARAMVRAALGGFEPVVTRTVIERQLDAFEAVWKAAPDHIDGHQHVQQFAGIREALVAAVKARYAIDNRAYFRLSTSAEADKSFKMRVMSGFGAARFAALAAAAGIGCAPALAGVYDFGGDGRRYAGLMDRWLSDAPEGAIIMCHPAKRAEAGDPIGEARVREYACLAGDAFSGSLARAGVTLSRGAQIHFPV